MGRTVYQVEKPYIGEPEERDDGFCLQVVQEDDSYLVLDMSEYDLELLKDQIEKMDSI